MCGISNPLLSWFKSYLTGRQQRVVIEGSFSVWLPVTSGVPQGSILGPIMFLVYIDDTSDYICSSSTVALFADESKLYRAIVQPSCGNHLPINLDDLHKTSQDWSMDYSGIKCNKVMHISKKKTPSAANGNYTLDGQQLESAPSITDLRIIVSKNISWTRHIEVTVAKANKTLGLLKRVCREMHDSNIRKFL